MNRRSRDGPVEVVIEPPALASRAVKCLPGYVVTKWSYSCAAADAAATSAITLTLPTSLSDAVSKELRIGRVLLWLGFLPSVDGTVKACLCETVSTAAKAFQSAVSLADNTKGLGWCLYTDFRSLTLAELASDITAYLYSSVALSAGDVVVHVEVEHVEPKFDRFFTVWR